MKEWLMKLGLIKKNFRGNDIPAGAGVLFIPFLVLYWLVFLEYQMGQSFILVRLIFLVSLVGGISLIDDMAGQKKYQGFKGHFSQLFNGNLTTGALKAIIIFLAVMMVVDWKFPWFSGFIDLGIILLMTNFLNLLDLRPGRALKFFFLASFALLLILPTYFIYIFLLYLLLLVYLPFELNGRVMLGDTGANILGVILGFGFSSWPSLSGKLFLFIFLLAFTLTAEVYSFSRIIERNRVLNWMDMLGRNDH